MSRRARTGCRGHISVVAPARSPPSGRPALFGRRYLRAEPIDGVVGVCTVANAHVTRGGCRACGTLSFWKAGRSGRGRRPRCHGAARAWRASEHEPGERQWAQRSDRPSMNAQGGTTSGSNESTAEGRTLRSGHTSVAVITPKFSRLQYSPNILNSTQSLLKVVVSLLEHYRYTAFHL